MAWPANEWERKVQRVQRWLNGQPRYDAICCGHPANYQWLTGGGRGHVAWASETGVVWVLVSRAEAILITSNIEAERIGEEESPAGVPIASYAWWEPDGIQTAVKKICDPQRVLTDIPMPFGQWDSQSVISRLRVPLLPEEQERATVLGRDAAWATEEGLLVARPEWTEQQLARHLGHTLAAHDMEPVMVLVAGAQRIGRYRHPLPTSAELGRLALIAVGARRSGLIMSLSRLVAWGSPDAEVVERLHAVNYVFDVLKQRTVAGAEYRSLWTALVDAYQAVGHSDAWQAHHQGGLTGYRSREWRLAPTSQGVIQNGELYAWNPSLPCAKVEDTLLVLPTGPQVLTAGPVFSTNHPALIAPNLVDLTRW